VSSTAIHPTHKMSGKSSARSNEWSLLLAACSGSSGPDHLESVRSLLRAPIDWKTLFQLADHHRVLPLLYQALATVKAEVPAQEMQVLERHYQINLHKAMFLSRELIRITDRLSELGVEFLPYKGLALAQMMYGDVALRQSGDIDVLIRAADLPRIRDAVQELGYSPHAPLSEAQQQAYLKSGYECAFDGPAGPNLLELQWAIQPKFYAVDFDMEGLFRRAVTVEVAGRAIKTPSLEDLFVVLCLHAAKHVWGRLVWTCDLARLMQLPSLRWDLIGMQTRQLRAVRIVRVTLALAQRFFGTSIPAAAGALPEDAEAPALSREIEGYIDSQKLYDVESLAYFRLMLRLRENEADRLRFLGRLAFTPGPGEWNAVRLPPSLFPLYRFVRIARLAARAVQR